MAKDNKVNITVTSYIMTGSAKANSEMSYKYCYAPSIIAITITRHASICSILYDHNY